MLACYTLPPIKPNRPCLETSKKTRREKKNVPKGIGP